MTGLDLEYFLRLLRSDRTLWINASIAAAFIGAIVWASRGHRRVLQRCLMVSLGAHIGMVVYGGPQAVRWLGSDPSQDGADRGVHLRNVQLVGRSLDPSFDEPSPSPNNRLAAPWEPPPELNVADALAGATPPPPAEREFQPAPRADDAKQELVTLVDVPDPVLAAVSPAADRVGNANGDAAPAGDQPVLDQEKAPVALAPPAANQENSVVLPDAGALASRPGAAPSHTPSRRGGDIDLGTGLGAAGSAAIPNRRAVQPAFPTREIADRPAVEGAMQAPVGPEGDPTPGVSSNAANRPGADLDASLDLPDIDTRNGLPLGNRGGSAARGPTIAMRSPDGGNSTRAVPILPGNALGGRGSDFASRIGSPTARALPDVPEIYRSRLAPNRSALAVSAGATPASEAAVERALVWLAKHQDSDGRWNGGTRRDNQGRAIANDLDFTAHCPADSICAGECFYWEADTAMTGLSLLAFLGAGHTHKSGPYSQNVALGINFLLNAQKPDGDLRGSSLSVGMYCHAMATLALSEALALTGDERLRQPVARALSFLVQSRSMDKQAWRYRPADPKDPVTFNGDTSILGWAVMALKSGKEVGVPIAPDVRDGILTWLRRVSDGRHRGLAMYRAPGLSDGGGEVRPSMTAEAWVCRQFLGVGDPGPTSDEAAAYILAHGPDRDPYNLYFWYYGTLALYQHGGSSWVRWNELVRDQLVRRQIRTGHADGSWDPAEALENLNSRGGRIYMTAVATLTLEVYYRYLRLYDAPATLAPGDSATDPAVSRARFEADTPERAQTPVPDQLP